jgi:protein-ribulosamine 3-kinase
MANLPFDSLTAALDGSPIRTHRPVSGGDIGEAYRLELADGRSAFLKLYTDTDGAERASAEARGLALLAPTVATPRVLGHGTYSVGRGFLLLEWLASEAAQPAFFATLGRQLADLHRRTDREFGLDHNNFIGRLRQANPHRNDWSDFYITARLEPQLRLAFDGDRLSAADRRALPALFRAVAAYPTEPPALLHGDLWSGNYLVGAGQTPYFIDPAAYYGHRELDLAMMQLFGGFPVGCFRAYAEVYPLASGWRERLPLGKLYYLLVHLNLFGATYAAAVREIMRRYG